MYKTIQLIVAFFVVIVSILAITGCVSQTQEPTPVPPTATDVPPTDTPIPPTDTQIPPTATASLLPPTSTPTNTATPLPSDTPTPTPTFTSTPQPASGGSIGSSVENAIRIYFIHLNVGGPVACGDNAIGVGINVARSNDVSKDAEIALKRLFSYKSEYVAGLYNPLFRSNIKVNSVRFNRSNGLITVNLRGKYTKPQDDCDNLRVKAQVWKTVRQFRGVKITNIYLNGIPFGDRVSNDK